MQNNMMILLPRPPGCCDACIEHATVASDAMIAVYCQHNRNGAWMYKVHGDLVGLWTTISPICVEEFSALMKHLASKRIAPLNRYRINNSHVASNQRNNCVYSDVHFEHI